MLCVFASRCDVCVFVSGEVTVSRARLCEHPSCRCCCQGNYVGKRASEMDRQEIQRERALRVCARARVRERALCVCVRERERAVGGRGWRILAFIRRR